MYTIYLFAGEQHWSGGQAQFQIGGRRFAHGVFAGHEIQQVVDQLERQPDVAAVLERHVHQFVVGTGQHGFLRRKTGHNNFIINTIQKLSRLMSIKKNKIPMSSCRITYTALHVLNVMLETGIAAACMQSVNIRTNVVMTVDINFFFEIKPSVSMRNSYILLRRSITIVRVLVARAHSFFIFRTAGLTFPAIHWDHYNLMDKRNAIKFCLISVNRFSRTLSSRF